MSIPYGSVMWTSEEPVEYDRSGLPAGLSLGALAAGGFAVNHFGLQRSIDGSYNAIKNVSNLLPFSIGHALRPTEGLFAYTSPSVQGLGSGGSYTWDQTLLKNEHTYEYVKSVTGLDDVAMRNAGLTPGMGGADPADLAHQLVYERTGMGRGSLKSVFGDGRSVLLSNDIALMQTSTSKGLIESATGIANAKKTNPLVRGVMGSLGVFGNRGFDEDAVFRGRVDGRNVRADVMPVPSLSGSLNSAADLRRRWTAAAGGRGAWAMQRVNDSWQQGAELVLGKQKADRLSKLVGMGIGARQGSGLEMFGRFGGKAAQFSAVAIGIQQIDWFRRQGFVESGIAAGATSLALGVAMSGLGMSAKATKMGVVASFFGQMALPGFDQGILPGLATTGTKAEIIRASGMNPFGYYRRTLEGFFPGISEWETGAMFALGAAIGPRAIEYVTGHDVGQTLLDSFGPTKFFGDMAEVRAGAAPVSVRRQFYTNLAGKNAQGFNPASIRGRLGILQQHGGVKALFDGRLDDQWQIAREQAQENAKANPLNQRLMSKLRDIEAKYQGRGIAGQIAMETQGFATQAVYSFFGADMSASSELKQAAREIGFRGPAGRMGKLSSVALAAFALHGIATGGLLGDMESQKDIIDKYENGKPVAVKKSRFWEGGGTPYGGSKDEYYRPHHYYLMMNRVREQGIWGADEDEISPVGKILRKNFTYELEERQYYDRPYPMTSAAFQDIPIIGGLLANSIGRLVKPPKLMHTEEWQREGEGGLTEYAMISQGAKRDPAYTLGAIGHGAPESPFRTQELIGQGVYQFRELAGLPGFFANTIQKIITGEAQMSDHRIQLATAADMTDPRMRFWEMDMGGGMFTNEIIRRVFPRDRGDHDKYNPIRNTMPAWMPERFRRGDPYREVKWGEARLPGAGYASMHEELRGVAAQDYPLAHRYKILGDIAPASSEFSTTQHILYRKRAEGKTTEEENQLIDQTDKQISSKMNVHTWDRVHERAIQLPGSRFTQGAYLGAERMFRSVTAPVETLTSLGLFGIRPVAKLMGDNRDPIEAYEYERLYNTPMAFWDKPVRDFLRPAFYSMANLLGYDGKPEWRRESDQTNEYFDKLEFVKWMKVAEDAKARGDHATAQSATWKAGRTRHGVNPQGSAMSIYWSLPAEERPFFNAFVTAEAGDRARILEMVPQDMGHLYQTMWARRDAGEDVYRHSVPDRQYLQQQYYGLTSGGYGIPDEDFIGWHEDVDIEDIKVRYIENLGRDLADFGMWESQLKKSYSQPMLEGSEGYFVGDNAAGVLSGLYNGNGTGMARGQFLVNQYGSHSVARLNYNDNRDADIASAYNRQMGY